MKNFFNVYDKIISFFIVCFFIVLVVTIFTQVILRYFFNSPTTWAEEIGRYLFVWIVYLSASKAFLQNKHLCVDILKQYIPIKINRILEVFINIAIIIFLFFVFYYSIEYVRLTWFDSTYSVKWLKLGWIYSAIPLGSILMILNIFRTLYDILK